MGVKEFTNKQGNTRYAPVFSSPEELHQLMFDDNTQGFCIICGMGADGVEPDARRYECESCGEKGVFGLEELVVCGVVAYEPDEETN